MCEHIFFVRYLLQLHPIQPILLKRVCIHLGNKSTWIYLKLSLSLFILSGLSLGVGSSSKVFHDFSLDYLNLHPLILVITFSVLTFFLSIVAIFKSESRRRVIVNLFLIVGSLCILMLSAFIFLFGKMFDHL